METVIRAIIIDDEEKARRGLLNLLDKFCPQIKVVKEASDIDDAYTQILLEKPDLIFLDIQMPNGNGFKLLRKFSTMPFDVIFVTGYDEYAINAIKFSALDYLLKPIEVNDLIGAVKKAIHHKEKRENQEIKIINLLNTEESKAIDKKIIVHQNEKVVLLSVGTIAYIEADDRYCHIFTSNHEMFTITKTLKEFEEYFVDNLSFFRINKNFILNINYIKNYSKGEPCFVEMEIGKNFEISRRKKQEFLERLKSK